MATTITFYRKQGAATIPVTLATSIFSGVNLTNPNAQISSDVWTAISKQSDVFNIGGGTIVAKGDMASHVVA
jgi:hypothetical protein